MIAVREDNANHYREFGNLWAHAELMSLTSDVVALSVDQSHKNTSEIMTECERTVLSDLPGEIQIFRAHHESLRNRCCWTLDYDTARNWAYGLPEFNQISTGIAYKRDVIAYISRRGESEVLMPAQTVKIVDTVDVG